MSRESRGGGGGFDQQHDRNVDDDIIEIVEERGRPARRHPSPGHHWRGPEDNSTAARRPQGMVEEEDDLWSEALAGEGLPSGRPSAR